MPKTQTLLRRLADFPDFVAATNRLDGLNSEKGQLETRIRDQQGRISKAASAAGGPSLEAASLTTGGPEAKSDPASELRRELQEAMRRRPIVAEAVELQRGVLSKLRSNHSRAICKSLAPEHRAILRQVAEAAAALALACERDHKFRQDLTDEGVSANSHLRPMSYLGRLGRLDDHQSQIVRCLQECVEVGVIDFGELSGLGVSGKVIADLRTIGVTRDADAIY